VRVTAARRSGFCLDLTHTASNICSSFASSANMVSGAFDIFGLAPRARPNPRADLLRTVGRSGKCETSS
jgi:hypothetical protein